jgi:hypothetical protein
MSVSNTKNQHFISQSEQRLNAWNPGAFASKQRIYEFKVVDRDQYILQQTSLWGRLIKKNLSMEDLFSFDVDETTRRNFEMEFGRYESQLATKTNNILAAHATGRTDIADDLLDLYIAKMVNFIRNPFTIVKVLNTYAPFAEYHPTNPAIYEAYIRTMTGRQPHQRHLCKVLGVSDGQYRTWLRILFMLLTPMAGGKINLLEDTLRSLFIDKENALLVHVHVYKTHRCLLSDRGITHPIEPGINTAFDFNLSSNAFIRLAFMNYEAILGNNKSEVLRKVLNDKKQIYINYFNDDMPALELFHKRIIDQSFGNVYCSALSVHGVTLVPFEKKII